MKGCAGHVDVTPDSEFYLLSGWDFIVRRCAWFAANGQVQELKQALVQGGPAAGAKHTHHLRHTFPAGGLARLNAAGEATNAHTRTAGIV